MSPSALEWTWAKLTSGRAKKYSTTASQLNITANSKLGKQRLCKCGIRACVCLKPDIARRYSSTVLKNPTFFTKKKNLQESAEPFLTLEISICRAWFGMKQFMFCIATSNNQSSLVIWAKGSWSPCRLRWGHKSHSLPLQPRRSRISREHRSGSSSSVGCKPDLNCTVLKLHETSYPLEKTNIAIENGDL